MKNDKSLPKTVWVPLCLPLLISLVMFTRLPENIPVHWNVGGQADAYIPKLPGAFFMPALCIVFLFAYIPSIPKERFEKSRNIYLRIAGALAALFLVIHLAIISISMGAGFIRIDYLLKFIIGILYIFMGNGMPKMKLEEKVLRKKPWMAKVQRHGGYVWFIAGVVFAVLAFIPGVISAVVYISIVVITAIEPMLYMYLRYERKKNMA